MIWVVSKCPDLRKMVKNGNVFLYGSTVFNWQHLRLAAHCDKPVEDGRGPDLFRESG